MNKNSIDREKLLGNIVFELNIVWLRWIFLFILLPVYISLYTRSVGIGLIAVSVISILYNFINYIILSQNKYYTKWFNNNIYIDILLITALISADGGYTSLIYISYYVFIIYESVKRTIKHPFIVCLFTCVIYTASVFLVSTDTFNIYTLIFRNIFVLSIGLISMDFVNQFSTYDKLHKKEYNLARKDKLTGLYNRTELEDEMNKEIEVCIKEKSICSILMFDLDNFKSFNDTYGHMAGDDLLRYFAKLILETIPSTNKAFRYGGEEFLILLKNTDIKDAYKIAEVIRKKLSSSNIYSKNTEGERKRVTVSCGIAGCPEHSISYFELIELADKALYEAKSEGKNKVVISEKETD